jgi:hypothetical protein
VVARGQGARLMQRAWENFLMGVGYSAGHVTYRKSRAEGLGQPSADVC